MDLSCFCKIHQELDIECFANYLLLEQKRTGSSIKDLQREKAEGAIKGFFFKKLSRTEKCFLEEKICQANTHIYEIAKKHNKQIDLFNTEKICTLACVFFCILASFFCFQIAWGFGISTASILAASYFLSARKSALSTTSFTDDKEQILRIYCPYKLRSEELVYTKAEHLTALKKFEKTK